MMTPELKAKWLVALRSGEYKQGKATLRNDDDCFCCLGVLADICEEPGYFWEKADVGDSFSFKADSVESHTGYLPRRIAEAEAAPDDVSEFADLIFLATDAAFRAGHTPAAIINALEDKLTVNRNRVWPDWTAAPADKAIEHVREASPEPTGWRDIQSAPKHTAVDLLGYYPGRNPKPRRIPDCKLSSSKRWSTKHRDPSGRSLLRANFTPTHWMPLPPPPGQGTSELEALRAALSTQEGE